MMSREIVEAWAEFAVSYAAEMQAYCARMATEHATESLQAIVLAIGAMQVSDPTAAAWWFASAARHRAATDAFVAAGRQCATVSGKPWPVPTS